MAALVIGGTGMLQAATRWLIERSSLTIIVARRASGFAGQGAKILPVAADWSSPGFAGPVGAAIAAAGPIDTALLWLHEPAPILPWLLPLIDGARIVLVLGSMDGCPTLPGTAGALTTVRLGSMTAAGGRRWLTHAEISAGAIAALQDGRSRIVGELARWS